MTPPTGISLPYHRGSPIHQARRCRTGRDRCRRGARSPPAPSPSWRPKRNRRCPLLPTNPVPRLTPGRAPTRELGGPHGGGPHGTPLRLGTRSRHGRRAPRGAPLHGGRQQQIRGSVPSLGARVLEVRIHLPPADSPSLSGFRVRSRAKLGFSAIMRTIPGGSCRQRRAKPSSVGPSSVGVSVGSYSSTALLRVRFAISAVLAASKVGCFGGQ